MDPDFCVLIPSARFSNLEGCVYAVLANEPELPPEQIIVIDDGAMADIKPGFPPVTWIPGVKPFIVDRNLNIGIRAANGMDLVYINDDARLKTLAGFSAMVRAAKSGRYLLSAAIDGYVGNPNQQQQKESPGIRPEPGDIAFICVCLTAAIYTEVGPFDERFDGYGGDDNDYCFRARRKGITIAVFDDCIVSHGEVPSTFRSKPDIPQLYEKGMALWKAKLEEEEHGNQE